MKPSDTRQKLIEAGVRAMLEKSYHAVGIKEILDDVGVPKGSFYHYFKSKEQFGIEVIEYAAAEHVARIRRFLSDRSQSPMTRFRAFFESSRVCHETLQCRLSCLLLKLSTEVCQMSPAMRAALKSGMDQWLALFAQFIREAQAEGELSDRHHADEMAGFIQAAWEGALMRMLVDGAATPLERFQNYIFDQLLRD